MDSFRDILSDLVANTGLSLRQLAKESDVTAIQYSRYLRGSIPTVQITMKIAKYFDCSLDYLFGLDENKNKKKYATWEYDISGFVDRYQQLLKANNITNFQFAKKSFFDESIIRHWKSGVTPRLDVVYYIAKDLGGSIDELLGRY